MNKEILLLNDLSYATGLIGLVELQERLEVADWLFGTTQNQDDPRGPGDRANQMGEPPIEDDVFCPVQGADAAAIAQNTGARKPNAGVVQFLAFKRWYFTIGDPDCAPSVPHGHENAKTQRWPKINPYTGKVFTGLHAEDTSRRLSRDEMKALWRNPDFVEFCREHVKWYAAIFPGYGFINARRGYLAFPRW